MSSETTSQHRPARPPAFHADRAVTALRELAETSTGYGDDPVALYATLVRLRNATRFLDQAVENATQWLAAANTAGNIGDDGEGVSDPAGYALACMGGAREAAANLGENLDAAAGHAGHLVHRT